MSDPGIDREYNQDRLDTARRILGTVDQMISGTNIALPVTDLEWIRAWALDHIEMAEVALGLQVSQDTESIARTIRLGMDAGALAMLERGEAAAVHLPELEDREIGGVHWLMHMPCPECGAYVEQTGPDDGPGGDHTAVTVHPDRDDYESPIGTRGGWTQVDLWCPAGHQFVLAVANHKGQEYIGCVGARSAGNAADCHRGVHGPHGNGMHCTCVCHLEAPR